MDHLVSEFRRCGGPEGFKEIATSFREIAKVEHFHESRFQALAERLSERYRLFKA